MNREYEIHNYHNCIDAHETIENDDDWLKCPYCGLKPKIWSFDNGRFTACGCWNDEYHIFSIQAESIMSVVKNSYNGTSCRDYDSDELRKNWNHYCETNEILFVIDKEVNRW